MSTTLQRLPDWPERLAAFIESRRRERLVWGRNDCVLFAADDVLALTGTDLATDVRGSYATELAAARLLREVGGVEALLEAHLPRRDGPGLAQRGDVVCVSIEGRPTAGVFVGGGAWCAPGSEGLVFRPMHEVELVFAVGG